MRRDDSVRQASACTRSENRLVCGCKVSTSEPRRMPSRTSLRVALDSSSSTGRARITVSVYEQTSDSEYSLAIIRRGKTDPIAAFLGALEKTPGDEFRCQAVRGRRGQVCAAAISVNVCTPPSANAIRIAVTLLVTDRPGSVEFPAMHTPHLCETRFAVKGRCG